VSAAHIARAASGPLSGSLSVPGDKSISHRAVLFAAMSDGTSHLNGVLDAADVRSTIAAVRALGVTVEESAGADGGLDLTVTGWGARGPVAPDGPIDCGNSGTTCRLLMGVLAGWPGSYTLTGDESLSRRPMRRVADPLASMGAAIELTEAGTLPAVVRGAVLRPAEHDLTVASAQVKTALLLAGLRCPGRTLVREPAPSRDHTERLLPAFGVPVPRDEATRAAWIDGPAVPLGTDVAVPGDPSSAAFLVGAAAIVPGSEVTVTGVALNPTRIGFLRVLERMGADVTLRPSGRLGGEPVGDILTRYTPALTGTTVLPEEIPSLVDEVPLLAIVAAGAATATRFEGAGELLVKESDRLQALADALDAFGVPESSGPDFLEVEGGAVPGPATLDSLGDHRLAMAYAVAGLVATGPVRIERFDAVGVSFPGFEAALTSLGA
jgi:3-phosphoshikimate 1-carboxyvinyltransferase